MVMPICQHPINKNGFIVYDLDVHPEEFFDADVDEMAARLYTPAAELPEGIKRIPLKQIHINKCPIIVPVKTMDEDAALRLNIDIERCQQHRELILQNIEEFAARTSAIFQNSDFPEICDPDGLLYSVNLCQKLVHGAVRGGWIAEFFVTIIIPLLMFLFVECLREVPGTVAKQHLSKAFIIKV